MKPNPATLTDTILTNLAAAEQHRAQVQAAMRRLRDAGMYPSVPTEQWQDRDGRGSYLYMCFPYNSERYRGPNGKRKVYIGCRPERVREARRKAWNRREYELLASHLDVLTRWISKTTLELTNLAHRSGVWPEVDLGEI